MKYAESHEWISVDGEIGTVGVSDHAQCELGDIVYVELPEVGKILEKGDDVAVLESTKAAADVYTPVSGEIIEVNENLSNDSSLINSAAQTDGWIFKIKLSDSSELDSLMDEEKYKTEVVG